MRKLLGVAALAAWLAFAFDRTYSVSGWLIWGWMPALWVDRQFLQVLPWPERKPLFGAVLLRLVYVLVGTVLVLPHYPYVPLSEGLIVGGSLSWLAFSFELLLGLASRRSDSRLRQALLAGALVAGLFLLLPLKSFHQFRTQALHMPDSLGLPYEDITLTTADGVQLAGWYVPHAQPRGGIVFCHGHGGNRQHVLGMLATMHELGLAVVAFDFRGHGDSPGHTTTFGHREIADVAAAEAFLAERLPGRPLFLSGVSYGGAVSLQALPHLPRIQAAWVDSAFARLTDVADNHFAGLPASLRNGLINFYSVVLWCDCGFWGPDIRPIDCLKEIRVPVHFCHGTADTLIPFAQAQAMYQACAGPKQHYWMEGATHVTRSPEASREYLRRFRGFIQEQLGQTASVFRD